MEKDRVGREIRAIRLAKVEKKLRQKQEEEKQSEKNKKVELADELTTGETHLWKWIQLEKNINGMLPLDVTLSQKDNFSYQLQIAKLLINSVLDSHTIKEAAAELNKEEIDDVSLDASLDQVIERCLHFVVNPEHLQNMANLLLEKGKFQSALSVCTKAFKRVQEMRARLEQKIKLQTQKVILEQEQARLEKIKKELPANQQKLLQTHKSIKKSSYCILL